MSQTRNDNAFKSAAPFRNGDYLQIYTSSLPQPLKFHPVNVNQTTKEANVAYLINQTRDGAGTQNHNGLVMNRFKQKRRRKQKAKTPHELQEDSIIESAAQNIASGT